MKLRGKYVVRQVLDDIMAIPVGEAALHFNGMIMLNEVSLIIWDCLEKGADTDAIAVQITDRFETTFEEAKADVIEFVEKLRKMQLLED